MRGAGTLTGLAVVVLLAAAMPLHAQYNWIPYNGHEYALTMHWQPWLENEAEAVSTGGHLVTINNEAENTWLAATFAGTPMGANGVPDLYAAGAHIGYLLNHNTGLWEWISGEPVTFTRIEGDPSFWMNNGGYAYMSVPPCMYAPYWGADPGHTLPGKPQEGYLKGIVERTAGPAVPEIPAPLLAMIGAAACGLLRRRRR